MMMKRTPSVNVVSDRWDRGGSRCGTLWAMWLAFLICWFPVRNVAAVGAGTPTVAHSHSHTTSYDGATSTKSSSRTATEERSLSASEVTVASPSLLLSPEVSATNSQTISGGLESATPTRSRTETVASPTRTPPHSKSFSLSQSASQSQSSSPSPNGVSASRTGSASSTVSSSPSPTAGWSLNSWSLQLTQSHRSLSLSRSVLSPTMTFTPDAASRSSSATSSRSNTATFTTELSSSRTKSRRTLSPSSEAPSASVATIERSFTDVIYSRSLSASYSNTRTEIRSTSWSLSPTSTATETSRKTISVKSYSFSSTRSPSSTISTTVTAQLKTPTSSPSGRRFGKQKFAFSSSVTLRSSPTFSVSSDMASPTVSLMPSRTHSMRGLTDTRSLVSSYSESTSMTISEDMTASKSRSIDSPTASTSNSAAETFSFSPDVSIPTHSLSQLSENTNTVMSASLTFSKRKGRLLAQSMTFVPSGSPELSPSKVSLSSSAAQTSVATLTSSLRPTFSISRIGGWSYAVGGVGGGHRVATHTISVPTTTPTLSYSSGMATASTSLTFSHRRLAPNRSDMTKLILCDDVSLSRSLISHVTLSKWSRGTTMSMTNRIRVSHTEGNNPSRSAPTISLPTLSLTPSDTAAPHSLSYTVTVAHSLSKTKSDITKSDVWSATRRRGGSPSVSVSAFKFSMSFSLTVPTTGTLKMSASRPSHSFSMTVALGKKLNNGGDSTTLTDQRSFTAPSHSTTASQLSLSIHLSESQTRTRRVHVPTRSTISKTTSSSRTQFLVVPAPPGTTTTNLTSQVTLVIQGAFWQTVLNNNLEEIQAALLQILATTFHVRSSDVTIQNISVGSLKVVFLVRRSASSPVSDAALLQLLQHDASVVTPLTNLYSAITGAVSAGVTSVLVVPVLVGTTSLPQQEAGSACGTGCILGITIGVGGGIVLVSIAVALALIHRRRDNNRRLREDAKQNVRAPPTTTFTGSDDGRQQYQPTGDDWWNLESAESAAVVETTSSPHNAAPPFTAAPIPQYALNRDPKPQQQHSNGHSTTTADDLAIVVYAPSSPHVHPTTPSPIEIADAFEPDAQTDAIPSPSAADAAGRTSSPLLEEPFEVTVAAAAAHAMRSAYGGFDVEASNPYFEDPDLIDLAEKEHAAVVFPSSDSHVVASQSHFTTDARHPLPSPPPGASFASTAMAGVMPVHQVLPSEATTAAKSTNWSHVVPNNNGLVTQESPVNPLLQHEWNNAAAPYQGRYDMSSRSGVLPQLYQQNYRTEDRSGESTEAFSVTIEGSAPMRLPSSLMSPSAAAPWSYSDPLTSVPTAPAGPFISSSGAGPSTADVLEAVFTSPRAEQARRAPPTFIAPLHGATQQSFRPSFRMSSVVSSSDGTNNTSSSIMTTTATSTNDAVVHRVQSGGYFGVVVPQTQEEVDRLQFGASAMRQQNSTRQRHRDVIIVPPTTMVSPPRPADLSDHFPMPVFAADSSPTSSSSSSSTLSNYY